MTKELLSTPLPRVPAAIDFLIDDELDESVTSISPSPVRRASGRPVRQPPTSGFGNKAPLSTPVGRAAMALIRQRASTGWKAESSFDAADPQKTVAESPIERAAVARDALRAKREAMARRMERAGRAYGKTVIKAVSVEKTPKTPRGERKRKAKSDAEGVVTDGEIASLAKTPVQWQTPATPAYTTSYSGGSALTRRTARLTHMTPHVEVRELRDFKRKASEEKHVSDAETIKKATPKTDDPNRTKKQPSASDTETKRPTSTQKPATDEALATLRKTMARCKRERSARREEMRANALRSKLPSTHFLSQTQVTPDLSRNALTPTEVRFVLARKAYGVEPATQPAAVVVVRARTTTSKESTSKETKEFRKDPSSASLRKTKARRKMEETRVAYSASPLRRRRFESPKDDSNDLPSLGQFKPRPPELEKETDSSDDNKIVVLPPRPRQPVRATRFKNVKNSEPGKTTPTFATPPPIRETSEKRNVSVSKRDADVRKVKELELERTARRKREAVARRERMRELRREKAKTFSTPAGNKTEVNKVGDAVLSPDFDASPYRPLGSHSLGSPSARSPPPSRRRRERLREAQTSRASSPFASPLTRRQSQGLPRNKSWATSTPSVETPPPIKDDPAAKRDAEKKLKALALERTTRRVQEAAARREKLRDARRAKAKAYSELKKVIDPAVLSPEIAGVASPYDRKQPVDADKSKNLRARPPAPNRRRRRERARGERVNAAPSPFASRSASARLVHARRAYVTDRAVVDDIVDSLISELVADARHNMGTKTHASRFERRRRREREREERARAEARAAADARKAARQHKKEISKTKVLRKCVSRRRVETVVVRGVHTGLKDTGTPSSVVSKRLERRKRAEAQRRADFALLTLTRATGTKVSVSESPAPALSKTYPTKPSVSNDNVSTSSKKPSQPSRQSRTQLFELELSSVPRGVSAFDWYAAPLPLGSAAAAKRATSAYAGTSLLRSSRTRNRSRKEKRVKATLRRSKQRVLPETTIDTDTVSAPVADPDYSDDFEADDETRIARQLFLDEEKRKHEDNEKLVSSVLNGFFDDVLDTIEIIEAVDDVLDSLVGKEVERELANARAARGAFAKQKAIQDAEEAAELKAIQYAAFLEEQERALRHAAEEANRLQHTKTKKVVDWILDHLIVGGVVRVAEEHAMKKRIAALRAEHEKLLRRLEWRKKLEFTPRAILRRTVYSQEEAKVIRGIEPGIAIRVERHNKGLDKFNPFGKPDLSWMEVDTDGETDANGDEKKTDAARLSVPVENSSGAFAWEPVKIELGTEASVKRVTSVYGGKKLFAQKRKDELKRKRRAFVKKLVVGIIEKVIRDNEEVDDIDEKNETHDATETERPVTAETIDFNMDMTDAEVDAPNDTAGENDLSDTSAPGGEFAFAPKSAPRKKSKSRPAFKTRPASPVSPLTPSGVTISPLTVSLRGVRKSLL